MLELLQAKPLLEPAWKVIPDYAYTLGEEVAEVAALAGFEPDPEQQLILNGMFGCLEDGRPSAFEVDLVGPRQNFKTGVIAQAGLGWMFVDECGPILYSAQDLKAAEECWQLLAGLIEDTPQLSKRLMPGRGDRPGIVEGRGNWAIHLRNNISMTFVTRGKNTGRALKGKRVVLDEGFAVTPTHIGALLPVLSAMWGSQFVLASSAAKVESVVLKDAVERGRGGGSFRQMFVEYGDRRAGEGCELADCDHDRDRPGCVLDDPARWAEIMPALGRRIDEDTVRGLRISMPAKEFARELMVWHDVESDDRPPATLDKGDWADRKNAAAPAPRVATMVIDVAPNLATTTIGIAGEGSDDDTPVVLVTRRPGTAWVVPFLRETYGLGDPLEDDDADDESGDDDAAGEVPEREIVEVALVPTSKASVLLKALNDAGIDYYEMTNAEAGQACGAFQVAVKEGGFEHVGQSELDDAVGNAYVRFSGEADIWDRRDRTIDIGPVVTVSAALWRWQLVGTGGFHIY